VYFNAIQNELHWILFPKLFIVLWMTLLAGWVHKPSHQERIYNIRMMEKEYVL